MQFVISRQLLLALTARPHSTGSNHSTKTAKQFAPSDHGHASRILVACPDALSRVLWKNPRCSFYQQENAPTPSCKFISVWKSSNALVTSYKIPPGPAFYHYCHISFPNDVSIWEWFKNPEFLFWKKKLKKIFFWKKEIPPKNILNFSKIQDQDCSFSQGKGTSNSLASKVLPFRVLPP